MQTIPLPNTRFTKSFSLMIVIIAYMVSYAFAAFSIVMLRDLDWHPLWKLAIADAVGTLIIYFFSVAFKNSSFYDAYWSVAPPVFLIFLIPLADDSVDGFSTVAGKYCRNRLGNKAHVKLGTALGGH